LKFSEEAGVIEIGQDFISSGAMSHSIGTILGILFILLSSLTASCTRYDLRNQHQSNGKLARLGPGPDSDTAKEFAKWVERVGKKYRLKQKFASNRSELVGDLDPSIAQPDLSGSFPGLKQYWDWGSVVSPATYIVVDQNGFGNFRGIWEAVNSIPNDIYRRYRITIQVNAGTYR